MALAASALEVSRATFRQAVRLLEQYFAVQTRRGPGGGLFVASPDDNKRFVPLPLE